MSFFERHIGKTIIGGLIIVFLILWFVPIEIAYKLTYTGKVYPAKRWSLLQDNNQYFTENRNLIDGFSSSFENYIFERGDIVRIEFNEEIKDVEYVYEGTPLLEFRSYLLEQEIANLTSQVDAQLANFRAESTGRKISVIQEAEKSLEMAKQSYDLKQKNYDRGLVLFNDSIIPEAEFQILENELQLAKSSVELADMELVSARTGRKIESLDAINAGLSLIERNLNLLNEKQRNYMVHAPFDGEIILDDLANSIVSIIDTNAQVVIVPIEIEQKGYINEKKAAACLQIDGCDGNFDMKVKLDKKVNIIDNRQVVLAKVEVPEDRNRLDEGFLVDCEIITDTVTMREYLKRKFF